ncbi:hypothetical protein D3C76_1671270 [compost metagenome]
MLTQLLVADRVLLHKRLVRKASLKQHMHDAQCESRICAGIEWDEPVGPLPCTIAMHINHDELRPLLAGFFDQSNLMHIRADEIASPDDN